MEKNVNPARGERNDFIKVTITLPPETLAKLKQSGIKRQLVGKKDNDVSSMIREAVAAFACIENDDTHSANSQQENEEFTEIEKDIIKTGFAETSKYNCTRYLEEALEIVERLKKENTIMYFNMKEVLVLANMLQQERHFRESEKNNNGT